MTPEALEALLYDWECDLTLERQKQDAPFFHAILRRRLAPAGRVAVLGCGSGRVAIPLSLAGWRVTGLDLSAERLGRARAQTATLATPPIWLQGDMRRPLSLPPQDAVIIPYSAFLLLRTDADRLACLTSVRDALTPAGLAIVDVSPNFALRPDQRRSPSLSGPAPELDAWVDCFETLRQRPREGVTFIGRRYRIRRRDGSEARAAYVERWRGLSPRAARDLAARTSFQIVEGFADYEGAPLFDGADVIPTAAKHIYIMARV